GGQQRLATLLSYIGFVIEQTTEETAYGPHLEANLKKFELLLGMSEPGLADRGIEVGWQPHRKRTDTLGAQKLQALLAGRPEEASQQPKGPEAQQALEKAISAGSIQDVRHQIASGGASPNQRHALSGFLPIEQCFIADFGHSNSLIEKLVRTLVYCGADLNLRTADDSRPLSHLLKAVDSKPTNKKRYSDLLKAPATDRKATNYKGESLEDLSRPFWKR
ncbi:MAG: hypothetical protein R3194_14165, partial [Limnobacter sp.]|nr:hypothetical protein [Limnobacter sp.]